MNIRLNGLKSSAAEKGDKARHRTFREIVEFYMIDYKTPLGRGIDIAIIALNLMLVAIFVIDTYNISSSLRSLLWKTEILIVAIFIVEYFLRLYGAPNRLSYVRDIYSIIDLAAIMPTIILLALPESYFIYDIRVVQTLRVLMIFRIFRFLRFISRDHLLFGTISPRMINVAQLVVSIIIIFFVYSGLFYFVDSPVNPDVQNFGDAFYFTVVAVSTVGFGDIVPASDAGRFVTVAMIISGIIIIPFQAARIFRAWLVADREKKMQICPGCGWDRHDHDAGYCKKCGERLADSENG